MKERVGEKVKNFQFEVRGIPLTQRHTHQRVSHQLHPLLIAPSPHCHLAETKARLAFYREEAVSFCNLPCPLEVRLCFLWIVEKAEVVGNSAKGLALVPETLHLAQDFGAPCLQPSKRERIVFAAC